LYLVTPGNPSVFADEVAAITEALQAATGVAVDVQVTNSYATVLEGLCNRTVHMGMLDAFGYLSASQRGCATPVFMAERDGETAVQGQLIANADSRITDVESFRGRSFCRPDAESAYGWIVPGVTLLARGIDPLNDLDGVLDASDDEGVVRGVYDRDCDVGATLLGAEADVAGLDEPERVSFIEALTPIPNEVVVIGSVVASPVREESQDALASVEEALLEVMSADALRTARDSDYDDLRDLFATAGIDVVSLAR
jgi:phosphonate transport system substrate-binding protein